MDDEEQPVHANLFHKDPDVKQPWLETHAGKLLQTICVCAAFLGLGLIGALPGPTLLDLRELTHTRTKEISNLFTSCALGSLGGSVVGGFAFDRVNPLVLQGIATLTQAVSSTLIPWTSSLWLMLFFFLIQGFANGIVSTCGNTTCFYLWGDKHSTYLHLVQFSVGLGTLFAPLIAEPFLSDTIPSVITSSTYDHSLLQNTAFFDTSMLHNLSQVQYFPSSENNSREEDIPYFHGNVACGNESHVLDNNDQNITVMAHSVSAKAKLISKIIQLIDELAESRVDWKQRESPDEIGKSRGKQKRRSGNKHEDRRVEKKHHGFAYEEGKTKQEQRQFVDELVQERIKQKQVRVGGYDQYTHNVTDSNTSSGTQNMSLSIDESIILPLHRDDDLKQINNNYSAMEFVGNLSNQPVRDPFWTVHFAYLFISLVPLATSVLFLSLFCASKQSMRDTLMHAGKETKHQMTPSPWYHIQLLVLLFFFYFLNVGVEGTYPGLLTTFVVEHLGWDKTSGTRLTTAFWGAFTVKRGLGIFLANWVSPTIVLVTDLSTLSVALIAVVTGLDHWGGVVWLSTIMLGIGMASIFPTGLSWTSEQMLVTGRKMGVFKSAVGFGKMIVPAVTGLLFDDLGPMWLLYVMMAACIVSICLFIVMLLLAATRRRPDLQFE